VDFEAVSIFVRNRDGEIGKGIDVVFLNPPVKPVKPLLLCIFKPFPGHAKTKLPVLIFVRDRANWRKLDKLLQLTELFIGYTRGELFDIFASS
jgi:hypothetical protein